MEEGKFHNADKLGAAWEDETRLRETIKVNIDKAIARGDINLAENRYRTAVNHGGGTSWHVYIETDEPEPLSSYACTCMTGFITENQAEKARVVAEKLLKEYQK
jgi:hypothetical protein